MSNQQWQNLPIPPGGDDDWTVFSADPRQPQNAGLRASDADRSAASTLLGSAFSDGRLDRDEYDQRLNQVMAARQLGELVPVLADVVVDRRAVPPASPAVTGARNLLARLPRWWIALALLFNAIWLMTCLGTGRLLYYWPMWPMFGTAIPIIMAMLGAGGRPGRAPGSDRRQLPPSGPELR